MSNEILFYIMGGAAGILVLVILVYYILAKKMQRSVYKKIQRLQKGTKEKSFSTEVMYQ